MVGGPCFFLVVETRRCRGRRGAGASRFRRLALAVRGRCRAGSGRFIACACHGDKHGARERQRLLEGSERVSLLLPARRKSQISVPTQAAATRVAACPTVSSEKLVFFSSALRENSCRLIM